MLTGPQADILCRMEAGAALTQSLLGDRLWSLLEDPWTVFDDVSPRRLRADGLIEQAERGSLEDDRADAYRLTPAGLTVLKAWRSARQP